MGEISKYNIYRKYMTSDGVNYTPLDEYQAVVTDLVSKDCALDYDLVMSYSKSNITIYFTNKNNDSVKTSFTLPQYDSNTYVLSRIFNEDECGFSFDDKTSVPTEIIHINWDKIFSMKRMFYGLSIPIDTSDFNTSNVTNMSGTFYYCSGIISPDLSGWDTSKVTDMSWMFSSCGALTSLDLSSFDTSNVTDMQDMFYGSRKLTSLDLSNFDTSNVTTMESMFDECSSLTSLDLSSFDTSNVISMDSMFLGCSGLTSLDLSNFDTSKVNSMYYMFYGCSGLTSLDLSSFDTSNVINMYYMFYNCVNLISLDLSGWDMSNVTKMNYMFQNCSSLKTIYVCGCNQATIDKLTKAKPTNAEIVLNTYVFNNEYVCDSELDVEQNGYKYEIWREVDCQDNSIYTGNVEYRNPQESCDCGWTGLTWVFNNEYINGSELQNARYVSFTDIDTATPFRTVRIDATDPGTSGYYFIRLSTSPNGTGSNQSYSICPDEGTIWDGGSSKRITAQTHIEGKIYEYTFSRDMYLATNQETYSPLHQVSAYIDGYDENSKYEIWRETQLCNVDNFTGNVEYRNPQPL